MNETREIMTAEQAAELLAFTPEHVRRLARENRIPCRKIGKSWRFTKRQLLEWVEAGGTPRHQPSMALD